MKVLTSLDLAKNPLLNFVPEKRSTAPSNPVEGQAYYDTTDKTFKQYDGTTWKVIGSTYVLPTASANTLGGVKVGNGLSIDQNGVLSATGGGAVLIDDSDTYAEVKDIYDSGSDIICALTMGNNMAYAPLLAFDSAQEMFYFGLLLGNSSMMITLDATNEWSEPQYMNLQTALAFKSYPSANNKVLTEADQYVLEKASTNTLGGVKVGDGLSIDQNGVLSAPLPIASANTLGGVKVGDGLSIDQNGVLAALGAGAKFEIVHITSSLATYTPTYFKTNYIDNGIIPIIYKNNDTNGRGEYFILTNYNLVEYVFSAFFYDWPIPAPGSSIEYANWMFSVLVADNTGLHERGAYIQTKINFETAYDASTNKAATMADIAAAITALGNVIELKGTKATVAEIEAIQNPEVGDMWICTADNSEWLYLSTGWEDLGHTIDLSGYQQISDLATDVNGTSETTSVTQKAIHDALEALPSGGTSVLKATGTISIASTSETITLIGVTTPDIMAINAYILSNGIREEVTIETSYNSSTKVLTCTSNGHEVAVNIEVFYKETSI